MVQLFFLLLVVILLLSLARASARSREWGIAIATLLAVASFGWAILILAIAPGNDPVFWSGVIFIPIAAVWGAGLALHWAFGGRALLDWSARLGNSTVYDVRDD